MSEDTKWSEKVTAWKDNTSVVPSAVNHELSKGVKLNVETPPHAPKSFLVDPFSLQSSMGYKDRRYSLTYDMLKMMASRVAVINAVLQTRCNQMAAFSSPYRMSKSVGYVIKHKDPSHLTTKGEREMIKKLEKYIYNCGMDEPNPHSKAPRDRFDGFLRKVTRDSLVLDAAAIEKVPDHAGLPYEFLAVDASTIRLAADNEVAAKNFDLSYQNRIIEAGGYGPTSAYKTLDVHGGKQDPAFVQVIQGQIRTVYSHEEMILGIRNPRTDIYSQGYGYSELEQLVTVITGYLNAEKYNTNFFQVGSAPKGILNLKGDNMSPDQLEGFRRAWKANVEGVQNSWSTPIFQAEQGVDWIDMGASNRDMEFSQWLEFITKLICAVYLIDPAEIGMPTQGGVSQTPLFESSSEWKLKASRDKGLKPLLKFFAQMINQHIIEKIDDHFVFDFAGLEELTELEKHELRKEQVASYLTLNEIRREDDRPDLEDGDVVLNPVYLQAKQIRATEEEKKNQAANAPAPGAAPAGPNAEPEAEADQEDPPTSAKVYADAFSKSVKIQDPAGNFVELDLGDWAAYAQ